MGNRHTEHIQMSDWTFTESNRSEVQPRANMAAVNRSTLIMASSIHDEDHPSENQEKTRRLGLWGTMKCCHCASPCLQGTVLGSLLGGIGFAIVLTYYLISTNGMISTTVVTDTTGTSTSSTTTTGTTATTTTSTTATTTTSSTSTATSSTTILTTTTPACTSTGRGTIVYDHSNMTNWIQIVYLFTATSINTLLSFAQSGGGNDYYRVDSPSVIDKTSPSGELLDNRGFNNVTGSFQGWNLWCTSLCTGTKQGTAAVANSSCRNGSVGSCVSMNCGSSGSVFFILGQYFQSVVGHVYNISFWYRYFSGGGGAFLLIDAY